MATFACTKCDKPTACLGGICWWCRDGLERPFDPQVEVIHRNYACRSWRRKESRDELDPFRENRIKEHYKRIWGKDEGSD